MNEMDVINAYVGELKLATFRENAEPYAQDAVREQWECLGYLRRLLEGEVTRRREKGKITRIHKAGFPQMKHLSLRTGKKATIITTNLPFTRWEEVLKDKVLCAALVDRLCHKSYLINMTGTSYRIKETKKLTKKI